MSTNIFLYATVETTLHTGEGDEKRTLREYFDCWQTPSEVTEKIMSVPDVNKRDEYLRWVWSQSEPPYATCDRLPLWYEEDGFHYTGTVDQTEYNGRPPDEYCEVEKPEAQHQKELMRWFDDHKGWNIHWEA